MSTIDLSNYRCRIPPMSFWGWQVRDLGAFTELTQIVGGREIGWMNDSPKEVAEHWAAIQQMYGDVLVTGLGLGVAVDLLEQLASVRSITVLESDRALAKELGPIIGISRRVPVRIVTGDAWEWNPGQQFTWCYHDIWEERPDTETIQRLFERYEPARQLAWGQLA